MTLKHAISAEVSEYAVECLLLMPWTAPSPGTEVGAVEAHDTQRAKMQAITTIGLDITESVFQVHGIVAASDVIISQRPGIFPAIAAVPCWIEALRFSATYKVRLCRLW